jgi:large subunit ribosomal protein L44e
MAKLPKTVKRYCPFCRKQTEQKIKQAKTGGKGSSLKRGSKIRMRLRGLGRGIGNKGKYSRPPIKQRKRTTKTTKKPQIVYTCSVCKKSKNQKKGKRTGKLVIE